jgi:uncharacterized protein
MEYVKNYLLELATLVNEMSPYLLFGLLLAGILHVVIPSDKVAKYLGKRNFRSVINAALLGIPLPLCSCGVIPTGLSFYKSGASKGSSISFLISTPQTGVDSMMITYSMLGLPMAILRPIIALITGIFGGWVTNKVTATESNEAVGASGRASEVSSHQNRIAEIFHYAFIDFLQDIAKWLVIGLLAAALMAVLIPDGFFATYQGNEFINMLLAILIAGPLYVCATGSVPIAAVLMMKGLSPGAALVFLMVGPATNLTTMTLVGKVLGRKTLVSYLATVVASAILFGIAINEFMPSQWFAMVPMDHTQTSHHDMLPLWLQISSSVILGLLLFNAFRLTYTNHGGSHHDHDIVNSEFMETKTVSVLGMTCNHCSANVERNLKSLPGIQHIAVDLQKEQAVITATKVDLALIQATVEGLGFRYGGEK